MHASGMASPRAFGPVGIVWLDSRPGLGTLHRMLWKGGTGRARVAGGLGLLLPLLPGTGVAAEGPCAPDIVEFRHTVELKNSNSGLIQEAYRFAAPPRSCKVVELPRPLDGMKLIDRELVVERGKLPRVKEWKKGQVLIVTGQQELSGGPFSEEVPLPPFAVARTVVEVTAPTYTKLSVWADPSARVEVSRDRVRRYRATFAGSGRLVWSTERDWWAVGDRLAKIVGRKVASKRDLGDFAEGVEYLTIADALKRVTDAVRLEPIGADLFDSADADEVLERGSGSAAERALLLVSVLRAAGKDADVALVRPVGTEDVSLAVPGLGLFQSVAVHVVGDEGEDIWLDPGAPYHLVGDVPIGMRGSIALVPGDYPRKLYDQLAPDGRVVIRARGQVLEGGGLEISASVEAEGGGTQAIRDVLAPLSKDFRKQWLTDLLTVVRPEIENVRFQVFGVEDPSLPLGMSIELTQPNAFEQVGEGFAGRIEPVLAAHLTRVLPSNVEVVEEFTLRGTDALKPLGVQPVQDPIDRDAVITRSAVVEKGVVELRTVAVRPWRFLDREENTDAVLFAAAERGPRVLLFDSIDRPTARKLRREANNTETRVLEALLWYQSDEPEEAERTLKRAVRTARTRTLLEILALYTPRGEFRPWEVMWNAVPTDHDRLAIVHALESKRERREAWRRASILVQSEIPSVRIEALVTVARIQGERPAASVDEAAHRAWREPALLLKRARKWATDAYGEEVGHPAVDIPAAEQLILEDACDEAGVYIERAASNTDSPRLRAIEAEWKACRGDETVGDELVSIIEASEYDPVVITSVVRAFWRLGRIPEARRWAFQGALIAEKDAELWMTASDAALEFGDLPSAVYCARRASDLQPESVRFTVPLQILATLVGDAESADLATKRTGYRVSVQELPVTMDNAETFVTEEQRLGFLRVRDQDVLADPELLQERAARQLALNDEVGTMRDAAWLVREHGVKTADATAYLAMAEELWSTQTDDVLARSVRDSSVRKIRMEYALLTGAVDPVSDARLLEEDRSAEIIRTARYKPDELAVQTGWPEHTDPDVQRPQGFRDSRVLSALPGVTGFNNRDAGASVLASLEPDRLPPPVQGVYSLGPVVQTSGRVTIHLLEGGSAPAYAATRRVGDVTWWGISRSRQLARYAVEAGIAAQSVL